MRDWSAVVDELQSLLKLRTVPFGMKALSKNGFRYPFPQYGVQQDVRAGMAVSYPDRK
jgi:hypothetical protein